HKFATFTPNSDQLYYMSNADSEFSRLWSYDLASGERAMVKEAEWDIQYARFSRQGRFRVIGINADARTRVEIEDTTTGREVKVPEQASGNISGVRFSRSGQSMVYYLDSETSPRNLFMLDFKTGSSQKLTESLNPAIDEKALISSEHVRFTSFDGREIPALLYKPMGVSAEEPAPALVWVHGGPGGQSRTGYNEVKQYLLNHGYGILAVNNRGSRGYGKTFYHLDDRKHGEDDLEDCVYGGRYLQDLDWVESDSIGIIGGSYGGYMVVAAMAFRPDAFDAGVDIFGVTNWVRTLESIPAWWSSFREYLYAELGDPKVDKERLRRISPLFHADKITKPLLVVQGANDPRVLQAESEDIVAAVRKNGVPVEYLIFDDEGHGFRHKKNRIQAAKAYLAFLDRHLAIPSLAAP
ncbi:MAG: prolyl oligopeptidase family serine peptidase, partial [Planctomycetota bacterium]